MTGLRPMLRKELWEISRTWRRFVFPLVIAFFAITGPVAARLLPTLMRSTMGDIVLKLPAPTYRDSFDQWTNNLGQMGVLLVAIMLGGALAGEVKSGTATLVLSKPVSRAAFVVAKVLAAFGFVAAVTLLGAGVQLGLTCAIFRGVDPWPLVWATLVWLVLALLMVCLTVCASAVLPSGAAASGVAFGVFVLLSILGVWGPAARYSPAGLGAAVTALGHAGAAHVWWPVGTSLVASAALVWLAVRLFGRREI